MGETPIHLGGHANITHVDEGALMFLYDRLLPFTMVDVGCGPGGQVALARLLGIEAIGIDGDPAVNPDVLHDFTTGPCESYAVDFAWSVEFLEHVEEKFLDNVRPAFEGCRAAAVTAAPPGKHGHHHVNLQPEEYWVEVFESWGFVYDRSGTGDLRRSSTMGREFMRRHGLLFVR